MTCSSRRVRSILVLAVFLAALGGMPGTARGAITNTRNPTIDGVTSTSAPPGSVMKAALTADVTTNDWSATQVQFGSQTPECINHGNQAPGAARRANFDVTAPANPGSYSVRFTPNENGDCGGPAGPAATLLSGLSVTAPAANPNLPPRCGINVMLVLDESGSIASSGNTQNVKNATKAFLGALSGTGAKVSIVDFSSRAARPVPYTTVTPETMTSTFDPYLATGYSPSGFTNWEAAFQKVREANGEGILADLVVFITDGDPTAHNVGDTETPVTGLTEGAAEAMRRAAAQADIVKGQKSHVFALGVGAAVTQPASERRLTAISGFDKYPAPQSDFSQADYTLVQNFNDLAAALRKIATELCSGSVTITKLVDEKGDGRVYAPTGGWTFNADLAVSTGSYTWVQPPPPPDRGPRSQTTGDDGVATFQWKPTNSTATSTVTLGEVTQPGYRFVDAACAVNTPTRSGGRRVRRVAGQAGVPPLTLKANEYAKCQVRNQIIPGTITIEKNANPESGQPFAFTSASLGGFTLVDDGTETNSTKTFTGLAPGTYTISEVVPDGWELTGITCSDSTVVVAGPQVTVDLPANGAVTCTYSDARIDPPIPPEPPDPIVPPVPGTPTTPITPTPVAPTVPGQRVLGTTLSSTRLRVTKTATRIARVGGRVRYSLTVRNIGSVTADNVRMADVPPAGLRLVAGAASIRPSRRIGGMAVWHLGDLAPGQSRRVTGTVVVRSGTAGIKRNRVFASASNARLVNDQADTRLLGRRRGPSFTG